MYCILFDGTFSFERWVVAAQHTNGANMVEATEDEQECGYQGAHGRTAGQEVLLLGVIGAR